MPARAVSVAGLPSGLHSRSHNPSPLPAAESTTYHFSVRHEHLEEAVDRFAQFFVAPLMTASATEREVNAVDAENSKNLQLDERRDLQLRKALCRPDHVWAKFGTGSKHTLATLSAQQGIDLRQVRTAPPPPLPCRHCIFRLLLPHPLGPLGPLRGVLQCVDHDVLAAREGAT